MTKSTLAGVMTGVGLLAAAVSAHAQTAGAPESTYFVSAEIGAQPQQQTIEGATTFPLYEETAVVTTSQEVHNGAVFGGSVGYKLTPTFGVALGVTFFDARESDGTVVASIPSNIGFDQPVTATDTVSGLKHSETGVHLQATWFHPLSDRMEIVLAGGPSVFKVKQDLAIDVTVPPGTQTIDVAPRTESKNAWGFNVGLEGNYFFKPQYGLGLFVRYAGAAADLPSVEDLKIGGLQLGLGFRARF